MSAPILAKLNQAWTLTPNLRFGQLIESVENIAWDLLHRVENRHYSARLMYLPDHYFEAALDQWIAIPFQRKAATS